MMNLKGILEYACTHQVATYPCIKDLQETIISHDCYFCGSSTCTPFHLTHHHYTTTQAHVIVSYIDYASIHKKYPTDVVSSESTCKRTGM